MNLIYSCVFYNREYIKIFQLLINSYKLSMNDINNYTYLIITEKSFKDDINKICSNLEINYDIWCLDELIDNKLTHNDNCFRSCYSRLYIYDYPNIKKFKKILYLDCDLLIANDLSPIFDLNLDNNLYVVHETCHRYNHCCLFSDDEYKYLDKRKTFSSCIMLFNNNNYILSVMETNMKNIKEFIDKYPSFYPPCFDQPFINKFCITNNLSNNTLLSNYCLIVNPNSNIDIVNKIDSYIICHFATKVGDSKSKLERMNYSFNIVFNK